MTPGHGQERAGRCQAHASAVLKPCWCTNWKVHADHSEPYQAKEQGYSETHRTAAEKPKSDAACV
jgi:hypothetical protein